MCDFHQVHHLSYQAGELRLLSLQMKTTWDSMRYTRTSIKTKQNKKKKERLACNLWKEGVQMLFMTLNLTISLFVYFILFAYLFIYFLVKKSNNLLTVNKNLKQETIIVFVNFVKFANCDNWIFSPESPVEKYVHFQAFTSVSFAKTFICRIMSQKKTMDNKIDCKSNSANSSQIQ